MREEADYMLNPERRMSATCAQVAENLTKSNLSSKGHFDIKAKKRKFDDGTRVLVLLPDKKN